MARQDETPQPGDLVNNDEYIAATEVAKMYELSIHTIRRRIREGEIFPGAMKQQVSGKGEAIWIIPRSDIESLSLQDISPRTYYQRRRYANNLESDEYMYHSVPSISPSTPEQRLSALEHRMSIVEQHILRLLLATDS